MSCCEYEASAAKKKLVSPSSSATDSCPVWPGVGRRWTPPIGVRTVLC
jgi:hypothetical protein